APVRQRAAAGVESARLGRARTRHRDGQRCRGAPSRDRTGLTGRGQRRSTMTIGSSAADPSICAEYVNCPPPEYAPETVTVSLSFAGTVNCDCGVANPGTSKGGGTSVDLIVSVLSLDLLRNLSDPRGRILSTVLVIP